jgi:hypothetical protein
VTPEIRERIMQFYGMNSNVDSAKISSLYEDLDKEKIVCNHAKDHKGNSLTQTK